MKDNVLFSAMGNIEEELIDEALNAPKKNKLHIFKITAAAASLAIMTLAAAIIVNISNKPDITAKPDTFDVQISEKTDKINPDKNVGGDDETASAVSGDDSVKADGPQKSVTEQPDSRTSSSPSNQFASGTSETQESEQTSSVTTAEDEESDMLGFIITDDGKTYMQVFNNTQYTLDKDIGRAGDFNGYYSGLNDNSRVYTVKEDENILLVKFESGGSVTLMLREEGMMDRMGYYRFNGLRVDSSLMAALSSNDGKSYSVYVTRPDSDDMYDYVYNGKTLRHIKEELDESWKTEHGKYNPLDEEYQAALHAFLKEKINTVYDILIENDIHAELINEVRCEMTMTKEQFENLAASGSISNEYAFGLSTGETGSEALQDH